MRASDTLLAVGFTLGAIATSGCSPNPPTDGFFGCASAGSRCPAAFPYCDPTDHRCYATAPVDSGPRPDTGPVPDTGTSATRVPELRFAGQLRNPRVHRRCLHDAVRHRQRHVRRSDVRSRLHDGSRHGVRAQLQLGDARLLRLPEHESAHRHGQRLPVRAEQLAVIRTGCLDQ
jgi:hypothetical protein